MTAIGTGYDLSAAQFSPDGRVFQVEYAGKAVENSGTAIALRGKDGVVFAVEKFVTSKLYEPGVNKRIGTIDRHIGCATAGLIADARAMAKVARKEAKSYRADYGTPIPIKYLKDRVSMYIHAHTLYSFVRPFGASLLIGSWDELEGPQLYCLEPSGHAYGYYGVGVGKAKQSAKTEIEKLKLSELSCEQLVKEAARIIYMVHDEVKDKHFELELSWVGSFTKGHHEMVPTAVFEEAEKFAKDALKPESDSEDE